MRLSADLAQRARLLGAIDILSQATGMTLMQTVLKASMAELREQIQRARLEAAYREGRSLPFRAIATLALTLLEEMEHDELDRVAAKSASEEPQPRIP